MQKTFPKYLRSREECHVLQTKPRYSKTYRKWKKSSNLDTISYMQITSIYKTWKTHDTHVPQSHQ